MAQKRDTLFPRGRRCGEEFRRSRGAFTIIELVVVCGIMVLLMSVAVIAVKSMMRGNSRNQAVNQLTTMIANAHAWALKTHMPAGLVIYEDSNTQSSVQVVVESTTTTTANGIVTYFVRAPNTGSQPLPLGIEVATLDDSSGTSFKTGTGGAGVSRIILFDGNGQLVLHNGLAEDPTLVAANDTSANKWNLNATTSDPSLGVSSPGLVVYNVNDYKAAAAGGATLASWLPGNSDVLIVNAYTGNLIR